jgi:hypothetical protein
MWWIDTTAGLQGTIFQSTSREIPRKISAVWAKTPFYFKSFVTFVSFVVRHAGWSWLIPAVRRLNNTRGRRLAAI